MSQLLLFPDSDAILETAPRKPRSTSKRGKTNLSAIKPYQATLFDEYFVVMRVKTDMDMPLFLDDIKLRTWTPNHKKALRFTRDGAVEQCTNPLRGIILCSEVERMKRIAS